MVENRPLGSESPLPLEPRGLEEAQPAAGDLGPPQLWRADLDGGSSRPCWGRGAAVGRGSARRITTRWTEGADRREPGAQTHRSRSGRRSPRRRGETGKVFPRGRPVRLLLWSSRTCLVRVGLVLLRASRPGSRRASEDRRRRRARALESPGKFSWAPEGRPGRADPGTSREGILGSTDSGPRGPRLGLDRPSSPVDGPRIGAGIVSADLGIARAEGARGRRVVAQTGPKTAREELRKAEYLP